MHAWMNGNPADGAALDIGDRGFLLGDGVFETLLIHKGYPAFWARHWARLKRALSVFQIKIPYGEAELFAVVTDFARKTGEGSVRVSVSRGVGPRGLGFCADFKPTVLITCAPSSAAAMRGAAGPRAAPPISLDITPFQCAEGSINTQHKTLAYADNILAKNAAISAGADDAIMLNSKHDIAGASAANVVLIDTNDRVSTPSTRDGALPGIVREVLIEHFEKSDAEINQERISESSLRNSAILLTNSLIGVCHAELRGGLSANDWSESMKSRANTISEAYLSALKSDLDTIKAGRG